VDVSQLRKSRCLWTARAPLDDAARHDLLELLDDRYATSATLVTSRIPVDLWHDGIGDPTFADAILDRLLNNAYRIVLKGGSIRRLSDSTKETKPKKAA
jgi:DNA replication protein DnaC